MEQLIEQIISALRAGTLNEQELGRILRKANKGLSSRAYTKRRLMPYLLGQKREGTPAWQQWGLGKDEERQLFQLLQVKPRRTASGVATITVITKPHPCSGNCLYCPNDIRMPKSYLANEPACQRALQGFFDPYLQVNARIHALQEMGHPTDKVELIVLGGTWSDYPQAYQTWFMAGLFSALNQADGDHSRDAEGIQGAKASLAPGANAAQRLRYYHDAGLSDALEPGPLDIALQGRIDAGELGYNAAFEARYAGEPYARMARDQQADMEGLGALQRENETASHRVVGLVIETRPDLITPRNLALMRRFGCTKVQMGVQTLQEEVQRANLRPTRNAQVQRAFELLRLFGFKTHAHFMVNLFGSTPEGDKADYRRFVTDAAFIPDEVKLYPCSLIGGTGLAAHHADGSWSAYDADTLADILVHDMLITPRYTRISRMIRDFSSHDIIAGNKMPNLRQMVEQRAAQRAAAQGQRLGEIRFREVGMESPDIQALEMRTTCYATTATTEHFLEWVDGQGHISGFLRLSLPTPRAVGQLEDEMRADGCEACPIGANEAMIREVHVYGQAAHIGQLGVAAQHQGLGRALIEEACRIAQGAGYAKINVISAVGTREYYRKLGFSDAGLYLRRELA